MIEETPGVWPALDEYSQEELLPGIWVEKGGRFSRRMPVSNAERQTKWRQRHPEEHSAYQREYMRGRRAAVKP
jgi:hypothetical protein